MEKSGYARFVESTDRNKPSYDRNLEDTFQATAKKKSEGC